MGCSLWGRKESDTTERLSTHTCTSALSRASLVLLVVKNPPANAGDVRDRIQSLDWEDPLEKGMATHSSILSWEIPWTEEPGGLQSMGLQRVGHD